MEDSDVFLLHAFDTPTLATAASKPLPACVCLNNLIFLFLLQHWFPLLFLAYSFLLCSVWHLSFLLLHFHLSFLSCLLPTQLQVWTGLQTVDLSSFSRENESLSIFLICLSKSTGKSLNRLTTVLGLFLLLLRITTQLSTTHVLSKCTTKIYPSYFRAFLKQDISY